MFWGLILVKNDVLLVDIWFRSLGLNGLTGVNVKILRDGKSEYVNKVRSVKKGKRP